MNPINRFKSLSLGLLFNLPEFAKRRLAGPPVQVDGQELDLDMQLMLKLSDLEPSPGLGRQSARMDASRRAMSNSARMVAGKQLVMTTRDLMIGREARRNPARLYTPESPVNALLLYFHGGGWAQGDLESHDDLCRHLACVSGAHVLSLDYRRSPENPWPAPIDDAMESYLDVVERLEEMGVSRPVIALGGDSAGANMATVVARKLSHMEVLQPMAQLLIYPAVDSSREHPSKALFADGFLLTLDNIRTYERFYIPSDEDRWNPDISPLLATDIDRLAPAIVVTAGFDPLRDEGRRYAEHLTQAGIMVRMLEYPGLIHGFANMLCTEAARQAVAEMSTTLRALFPAQR